MNLEEKMKMAMTVGEIMLSNGAETYRVEDTMTRILKSYNFSHVETFVIPTGIFASVEDTSHGSASMLKRIKKRTFHLGKVAMANNLSRDFVSGKISFDDAVIELERIDQEKSYSALVKVVASGFSCFCFTYMFSSSWPAAFISAFIGIVFYSVIIQMAKRNVSDLLQNIVGGLLIAIMALGFINAVPSVSENFDKIIIGSIMPLVPGVGITNAIRDILEGDYLSGASRVLDAALVAVAIAAGVGITINAWFHFFGGFMI